MRTDRLINLAGSSLIVGIACTTCFLKNNINKPVENTNEAIAIQDSLRMDSLIKKAYFEGAQMVRDSIAGVKKDELKQKL
mgnify:CR=1 FL=1